MKEGAGLIREDLAGHFITGGKGMMGTSWWFFGSSEQVMGCGIGALRGTEVLSASIEMPLDCCLGYGRMEL